MIHNSLIKMVEVPGFESSLDPGFRWEKEGNYLYVNWLDSETEVVRRARAVLGVDGISPEEWVARIREAMALNECPEDWRRGTWRGLGRPMRWSFGEWLRAFRRNRCS
jgi:hypothetical protein